MTSYRVAGDRAVFGCEPGSAFLFPPNLTDDQLRHLLASGAVAQIDDSEAPESPGSTVAPIESTAPDDPAEPAVAPEPAGDPAQTQE